MMSFSRTAAQLESRFRVVYAVRQKTRIIRLMAVGHRRSVYEELTERLRRKTYE
ncbi:MAG: hypothetical protein OJF51_004361 [Nitrospira sp.]|jgi:hypothetical protein|nr:MAG: hypothetical protein OJF51_004361 [Nitrospira sp.]